MRVTILGSGTLLPDVKRGSAAHLVEDGDARLLLDCGGGILRGMDHAGIDWTALSHIAITHFHTDHIGGLPALLWALYGKGLDRGPLTLLGPKGLRARMNAMADAFGSFILGPGFPVELVELEPGAVWREPGLELRTHDTEHTAESMAYRVDGTGSVGYTGDTGPTSGLGSFFAGVDVLVSECAAPDRAPHDGHLTPSTVAALARQAECSLVVITHVYPDFDPERLARAVVDAGISGRCLAGYDGLTVEVADTKARGTRSAAGG